MAGSRVSGTILCLLLAAASSLAAQRRELSFAAGPNLSSATGNLLARKEARVGFFGGLSLRIPRAARISVQTDLTLVERRFYGERAPSTLDPRLAGPFSDAAALTFAQLGVLARIQRGYSAVRPVRPFLTFGAYTAVLLHCNRRLVSATGGASTTDCSATPANANGASEFIPAVYQDVDLGLTGSIGVEIRRLAVSVRGEKSFRNLVEVGVVPTSPFERARIWSVGLVGEYLLRVM